ncbi:P-loop containing nucleoside triphosphate hydrolase protein [Trichoderma chlorosporum]
MSNSRTVANNHIGDNARIHLGDIRNEIILKRRETPPRPLSLIPFRRDPDFVNRGDIIDQISARCLKPAGRVALFGLGGVGKSQLAIEFAHRIAEAHDDIWVFWIYAATQARVQEGFRMIADAVKLPGRDEQKADIPLLVQNWLSNERNGRWIIILDSADNSEILYGLNQSDPDQRPLSTYFPQSRNGSILLTTRSKKLASKLTGGYNDIIEVQPMTETDALNLLEKTMGSPLSLSDTDLAKNLVDALDYIPLAISQAGAYIQARKPLCSLEKYLNNFRKSEKESMRLLEHEAPDIGRDEESSKAILKTWTISFEHIRSRKPGNNPNSKSRAAKDSEEDIDNSFEEDILILREYCLITVNEEGNKFEMHRLVQLSIKIWLKAFELKEMFMQTYIKRMATSFPKEKYENWTICEELFAHAQLAVDYRPDDDTVEDWATLCYKAGYYAYRQGRYAIAQRMVGKCRKARENKLGKDHAETLECVLLLSRILEVMGRWEEAEKLQTQILDTHMTKLGPDHLDTVSSMSYLASTFWSQGRWEEAEKLQVQALETCKNKLGPDHLDTLISMSYLALTFRSQGRWEEAEKLQVQALETCKTKLGPEHLSTLTSMHNLALIFKDQGRLKEAEKLHTQVLETYKNTLGANHPDTLASMNNLALTLFSQGRWKEAEKLQMQVLETRKNTLGANHPDTLISMYNLALTFFSQGRWKEAEKLQMQLLETQKAKLGLEHPNTLTTMSNLAQNWRCQGRDKDALALMEDCFQIMQRVLGPQHPNTLTTMSNLAQAWRHQGRDKDALALMEDCFQTQQRVLGPQHPNTLNSPKWIEDWSSNHNESSNHDENSKHDES